MNISRREFIIILTTILLTLFILIITCYIYNIYIDYILLKDQYNKLLIEYNTLKNNYDILKYNKNALIENEIINKEYKNNIYDNIYYCSELLLKYSTYIVPAVIIGYISLYTIPTAYQTIESYTLYCSTIGNIIPSYINSLIQPTLELLNNYSLKTFISTTIYNSLVSSGLFNTIVRNPVIFKRGTANSTPQNSNQPNTSIGNTDVPTPNQVIDINNINTPEIKNFMNILIDSLF